MILANPCQTCGELKGYFSPSSDPSLRQRAFCRCQPEGWVQCTDHPGNIRRRTRITEVTKSEDGKQHTTISSTLESCAENTCITPSDDLLERVVKANEQFNFITHG